MKQFWQGFCCTRSEISTCDVLFFNSKSDLLSNSADARCCKSTVKCIPTTSEQVATAAAIAFLLLLHLTHQLTLKLKFAQEGGGAWGE